MKYIDVEQMSCASAEEYVKNYSKGEYCHQQSFSWGFQEGCEFAENAINHLQEIELKKWFIELLNILKNNQCARVIGNNRKQLDVTKIAHTYTYASFFDIFNNKHLFDINIKPICIDEKPNKTISKFYGHNDYI